MDNSKQLVDNNKKLVDIKKWSNPAQVQRRAAVWLGKNARVYLSTKRDKKYMVQESGTNKRPNGTERSKGTNKRPKWVHFGQMGYEDYTKHNDTKRRKNYLQRSTHIRGKWKTNKYSPNNLSIHLLW
jgi:hypothetical protein